MNWFVLTHKDTQTTKRNLVLRLDHASFGLAKRIARLICRLYLVFSSNELVSIQRKRRQRRPRRRKTCIESALDVGGALSVARIGAFRLYPCSPSYVRTSASHSISYTLRCWRPCTNTYLLLVSAVHDFAAFDAHELIHCKAKVSHK